MAKANPLEVRFRLAFPDYSPGALMWRGDLAAESLCKPDTSRNRRVRIRFDPAKATGPDACPFTTLYWDFLLRHEARLAKNQRMALKVKNLARLKPAARALVQQRAGEIKANGGLPLAADDGLLKA